MTSKRPVTHPALQRAYSTHEPAFGEPRPHGFCICPSCVLETTPPDAPREPLGGAEASSGTTGRGEGSDAADGRTAVVEALVQADRATAEARTRRLTRERDDLLAMKARVEALADVWRPGETRRITTRLAARILCDKIRGES